MKIKTKFLSLFFALFMFLVSITTLGIAVTANASHISKEDEENYVFPNSSGEYDPDENLTSLYYFSDYYASKDYFEYGFVRELINLNGNITDPVLNYWNSVNSDGFWSMINNYISSNRFLEIENAFVIFEVRNSFEFEYTKYGEDLPEYYETNFGKLDLIFSILKSQGCKIMFISGLDESTFEKNGYNEFLGYVDIHINLDLFTTYVYTVLTTIPEKNYNDWDGITIVFDENMPQYKAVYGYLISRLMYELQQPNPYDYAILDAAGVNVYFYNQGAFSNVFGNYVQDDEVYNVFDSSNGIYIIGNNLTSNDSYIESIIESYDEKSQIFEYNDYSEDYVEYYLSEIMWDFILNNVISLERYNNRSGRCDVTFKPLFYSSDGWMREPQQESWLDAIKELPELDGDADEMVGFLQGIFG